MKKVPTCFVTDSGADLSPEYARDNNIFVLPHVISLPDGNSYKDWEEITPEQIYKTITETKNGDVKIEPPKYSDFLNLYKQLITTYDNVISIHTSSKLSNAYQNALIASQMLKSDKIHVVDSLTISGGLGILLYNLLPYVEQEIFDYKQGLKRVTDVFRAKTEIIAYVEDIHRLQKHPNVKINHSLGGIRGNKAIVRIKYGEIETIETRRSHDKAIEFMVDYFQENINLDRSFIYVILHSNAVVAANNLYKSLFDTVRKEVYYITSFGPVLYNYLGLNALALTIFHE